MRWIAILSVKLIRYYCFSPGEPPAEGFAAAAKVATTPESSTEQAARRGRRRMAGSSASIDQSRRLEGGSNESEFVDENPYESNQAPSHGSGKTSQSCVPAPAIASTYDDDAGPRTESTPLSPERRSRRSSASSSSSQKQSRRRSSAEKLVMMIKKRFSLEGNDEGNFNDDEYYEDDSDYDGNNEGTIKNNDESLNRDFHSRDCACRYCRLRHRRRRLCIIVCGLLITLLLVVVSHRIKISNRRRRRHHHHNGQSPTTGLYNSETCDADPIQALKDSSYLDGLENGAVASDHTVCSSLGSAILQQGGNAVDSAVATILCLGVANPASSGLGGGAFILIHSDKEHHKTKMNGSEKQPSFHDARDKDQKISINSDKITEVIDCREVAPMAGSVDMFVNGTDTASTVGGLAIAVPGELRGLELAHARHGKLPWSTVVEPVVKLARDGVPVSHHLAGDIKSIATTKAPKYEMLPKLRSYLTVGNNWDHYLKEGELLRNPQLAKVLQSVMSDGADALYTGENAKNIVQEIQDAGGVLTIDDLRSYRPTLRSPVVADTVNGFTLAGIPPPSSGGATVIGAARFLSGYNSPFAADTDTLSVHRMVEALRHAFAIRMSLSDPDFSNTTNAAVRDLISGPYMESLRKMSKDNDTLPLSMYGGKTWAQLEDGDGDKHAGDHHEGDRRRKLRSSSESRRLVRPFGYLEDSGTSHLSVVDKDGNSVSVTSSVNAIFGSYVFSETTGILLGNTMDGKFDTFEPIGISLWENMLDP